MKYILILLISFAFGQSGEEIKSKTASEWNEITDKFEQSQGQNYGSFAFGQITEIEVMSEEEWYFPIGSVPVVETEFEMPFELESIKIWHFLEYAEECYNDSTMDYIHLNRNSRFPCVVNFWNECQVKGHRDRTVYNHRKPTFKGFIEWFENRRNK